MFNQKFAKFVDLQKSNADAFAKVAVSAIESVEKVTQLNLAKGRALVATAGDNAKETLQSKKPADIAKKSSEQFQSQVNDSISYSHNIYNAFVKLQQELTNAFQAQVKLATEAVAANVEQKQFPGSDTFSSSIKSMIEAGNKTIENVTAAAKQFSELAESNIKVVARIGDAGEKKAPASPAPVAKKAAVIASTAA